jgi:hypothetical protein
VKGNGVAALRMWPVTGDLGGATYRIAPLPAIRWIIPIVDDDWFAIVPGMLDPADRGVDDALDDGAITHDDCVRAARDAVGVASGVSWWSAVRLVQSVMAAPDLTGELLMRGIDAQVVSLGAFVQAAYRLFTRDTDKKQRARVDRDVEAVPPELTLADRWEPEAEASGFEAMMRQRGGRA